MWLLVYWLILILIILSIVIYMIWLSKIIKLLLWNYIVSILILSLYKFVENTIQNINATSVDNWVWVKSTILTDILEFGGIPFLIVYVLLLFLIYKISRISIVYARWFLVQKTIKLIYAPLTALSIIFSIGLLAFAMGVVNPSALETIVNSNEYLKYLWKNIWIFVFFHSVIVLLITSRINVIWFKKKESLSDDMLS